ncbi:hypothetical protein E0500_042920 [Streptomyces sp. KM273126]|uniref:hypothetical protein n=1 Tax=Streptomyces sp. KM273126 TaxID=2545247 RepID=UPI00103CFE26|nr:hypothetical protein [Streptomyces sp. KM273126]MBA2813882.1 hypothetical protein [Streptomyces sp. KM273126]
MNEVYAFIEAEKTTHHVALLCQLLKAARSSFYARLAGKKTRRAKQAAVLRGLIRHAASPASSWMGSGRTRCRWAGALAFRTT